MSDVGRVLVLAGGLSPEHEVSLRSGRRVAEALQAAGVEVQLRDVDLSLLDSLRSDPPDVVFPVLHGASGEGGALRGLLDLLDLPYVGSDPHAARLAFDKPSAKAVLTRSTSIATPRSLVLPTDAFRTLGAGAILREIVDRLGIPLVVKPTRGGSALGVSVVTSPGDLPDAVLAALEYGDAALIEREVSGTEIAVSVVDTGDGPVALPAVEIAPDSGRYDYTARYTAGATEFFVPARLSASITDEATAAALSVHRTLGLRDLSRTDLIVDAEGQPWFLEVNVAPGMTSTSTLPQAAEAAGLDLGVLCRDLVHAAAGRARPGPSVARP